MIKKGLVAATILVAVSILVIEQRKSHWSKAGNEVRGAATAVGHAVSESSLDSWDTARRASEKLWYKTRQKSAEAWDKSKESIHEGVESIKEKDSG